ncbi:MAG: hypothetical protein IRY94_04970 [Rhodospirillaceae bacterium]|nr:hypothetical protein [Rhodospirillaceae bacterium]
MGTRIVERVTADMTGRFASETPTAQLRQATQQAYGRVTREGRPLLHRGARVFDGRTFRYEILRLPLSEDGRPVTMILAASLHNDA